MYRLVKWLASGGAVFLIGAAPAATADPAPANPADPVAKSLNILIAPLPTSGSELQAGAAGRMRRLVMTILARHGHAVFDGDSITGGSAAGAQRMTIAATIAGRVAKTLSTGLDAVVVVSAKIGVRRGVYTSHIETRFGASLMDGRSGRFISHVDSGPVQRRRVAAACGKDCLGDLAAGAAEAASRRLASAIARRLAAISPRPTPEQARPARPARSTAAPPYVLAFRGFGPDDIEGIAKYLTVFPGFGEMWPGKDGFTYRYRSDLDVGALKHALGGMLRHLRIGGQITHKGGTLTVTADRSTRSSNDW